MNVVSACRHGYLRALTVNLPCAIALVIALGLLSATARGAAPDHPIITEVYNDPSGLNDGPLGHDPTNANQEYIEIYLPTAADLAPGLNKDALNLTFYEVEGDTNSSGYTLVNYRIDLPTFDLDPTEIPTVGAIPRPASGIVVIGWVDYTNNDTGTCSDNAAPCSLLAQDCSVGAKCDPNMPTALAGTPGTRLALIKGGITTTTDFLFVALNGDQFGGTTNFPVPTAVSLINMPNEARSGLIQNGSAAYLLVDRDNAGYVELYDDKDAVNVPLPDTTNANPSMNDGSVLGVSSLLDGLAVNDHVDFILQDQPYQFGVLVDLANVLPQGGPFTPLVPQLAEGLDNGYLRLIADAFKTSEDAIVGNEDPAADAQNAYRNISNLGPWFATPGRATFTGSAPDLAVASSSLQVLDMVSLSAKRIDLVAANLGGNIAMSVTATPGVSSDPASVTFSPAGSVIVDTAQTAFKPGFNASVSAAAVHDALVLTSVFIEGSTVNAGDPPVINPVWQTTATVQVLNPTTGQDANGLPFETTVFVAIQGVPQDLAVTNEFLATDLGAFLAAQPDISALDTFGQGLTLIAPTTNLSDPTTARAMISELPGSGEECINWLPRPCCPMPPGFVDTVLNSAEVVSGALSYTDPSDSSIGTCTLPNDKVRGIRVNLPDTQVFDGPFSPSETLHFVNATGGVSEPGSGLTGVTTDRTFEVALIDTTVNQNGSLETGAADDFGIIVEVEQTELGAPVANGDYVFLSMSGGKEGADIDTLNADPGNNVAIIIYLDLDNLHDVLGIRSIEALYIVDARGGSGVDIMEGFSLNLSTASVCAVDGDCDDANVCTDDTCVGNVCQNTNNAAACDDGNACTTGDACSNGGCVGGTPLTCNDVDVCTDDSCNPATGCVFTNNTAPCNDSNACTTNDACSGGSCVSGPLLDCDDSNVCTTDSCDSLTGCVHGSNTAPCNDGNACTTNDTCSSGGCVGGPSPNCDDGNVCTDDSCNPAVGCVQTNNTSPCDDGLFCTLTDVCSSGLCAGGGDPCSGQACDESANSCFGCVVDIDCDDQNVCTLDTCVGGNCIRSDVVGTCNDGNACTTNDACSAGVCVGGTPPDCNDGNVCTTDSCFPASGCVSTNNIATCNDGDACTTNDNCSGGACVGGPPLNCDDSNGCTDDSCDSTAGCTYVNNAASCNDGDACTTTDVCSGGICLGGSPPDCDDGNGCTDDACNPTTGCVHSSNTAPCNDGLFCTLTDVCSNGLCLGTGDPCPGQGCDEPTDRCFGCLFDVECDDLNACTFDQCVVGSCQHTNVSGLCDDRNACTTGDACAAGVCVGGPAVSCSDGNPCTTDSCDPLSGCINANNVLPCDDGNACTTIDICSGGGCLGIQPPDCNDGNVCTDDSCDPASGCVHAGNTNLCADDLFCNGTETCVGGACQAGNDPCPGQLCDAIGNLCGQCQNNGDCDDGAFCNGIETCDAVLGCERGAQPVCDDGVGCTIDFCHAVLDSCRYSPVDAICDNGVFCDGAEICDRVTDCQPGPEPCVPGECNEAGQRCGACLPSTIPAAELLGAQVITKNRFLSFEAGDAGQQQAILVTFMSLPPPFDIWDGSKLWVGPPGDVSQNGSSVLPIPGATNFKAASLQCLGPDYRDWSTFPMIHVFHEGVVPGGLYQIQVIDENCADLADFASYSAPLDLMTSILGDVVEICASVPCSPPEGSVAIADALAILARFASAPGSIVKPRADLEPGCLDLKINIADVLTALRGFQGLSYVFAPATQDPCDSPCQPPL